MLLVITTLKDSSNQLGYLYVKIKFKPLTACNRTLTITICVCAVYVCAVYVYGCVCVVFSVCWSPTEKVVESVQVPLSQTPLYS